MSDVSKPTSHLSPADLSPYGFADLIRSGNFTQGDAETVARKFEILGDKINELRAVVRRLKSDTARMISVADPQTTGYTAVTEAMRIAHGETKTLRDVMAKRVAGAQTTRRERQISAALALIKRMCIQPDSLYRHGEGLDAREMRQIELAEMLVKEIVNAE